MPVARLWASVSMLSGTEGSCEHRRGAWPRGGAEEGRALIGRVLGGRYAVDHWVGGGGMATVYRGLDTLLDRPVALKVLRAQLATDPDFVRRFRREARAAARLSHPNIIAVYDVGSEGQDCHYIVQEFVDGDTLKERIVSGGPLAPSVAARIMRQVLDALVHAHRLGVIHRDVKPQNVLLARDGRVKVTDFGIALAESGGAVEDHDPYIVGTAHYAAPEQVRGDPTDERSDIYSAGVMFYEMLTGALPAPGDSAAIAATTPLDPDALGRLAPRLAGVLTRAVRAVPGERYANAAAFRAALDGLVGNAGAPPIVSGDLAAGLVPEQTDLLGRGAAAEIAARLEPRPVNDGVLSAFASASSAAQAGRAAASSAPASDASAVSGRALRGIGASPGLAVVETGSAAPVLAVAAPEVTAAAVDAGVRGRRTAPVVGRGRRPSARSRAAIRARRGMSVRRVQAEAAGPARGLAGNAGTVGPASAGGGRLNVRVARGASGEGVRAATLRRPPPAAGRPRARPVAGARLAVLVAASVAALAVAGGLVAGIRVLRRFTDVGAVQIPVLAGSALPPAEARLKALGLTWSVVSTHASAPAGDVVRLNPVAGSVVRPGSPVQVQVSLGPSRVVVPRVAGLSPREATIVLGGLGLRVRNGVEVYSVGVPVGYVVRTVPVAGAHVDEGMAISLVSSLGPAPLTTMPDYVGQEEASVERDVARRQLVIGRVNAEPTGWPAGVVAATVPAGGATVAAGTSVNLVVSSGCLYSAPIVLTAGAASGGQRDAMPVSATTGGVSRTGGAAGAAASATSVPQGAGDVAPSSGTAASRETVMMQDVGAAQPRTIWSGVVQPGQAFRVTLCWASPEGARWTWQENGLVRETGKVGGTLNGPVTSTPAMDAAAPQRGRRLPAGTATQTSGTAGGATLPPGGASDTSAASARGNAGSGSGVAAAASPSGTGAASDGVSGTHPASGFSSGAVSSSAASSSVASSSAARATGNTGASSTSRAAGGPSSATRSSATQPRGTASGTAGTSAAAAGVAANSGQASSARPAVQTGSTIDAGKK